MAYLGIKETSYQGTSGKELLITVPHGGGAEGFLEAFPEIAADRELKKVWPLFLSYLEIERDTGASELAHSIARIISLKFNHQVTVYEMTYPRGILDGGRLRGHALRHCLPHRLMEDLQDRLLALHDQSLTVIDAAYGRMGERGGGHSLLLDVHTMASFCPVNESGIKSTFPISFPRLEAYVLQYLEAKHHNHLRSIDLICADEKGQKLADPTLLYQCKTALLKAGYSTVENEPYHAAPIYLSYQHMRMVPSLSLDVPKHCLTEEPFDQYQLDQLRIDPNKVEQLAACLAAAVKDSFT